MKKTNLSLQSYGKSMSPLINPGDRLEIQYIKQKKIKISDIIVFYDGERCVSHRVIKKKKDFILTTGDNVLYPDKELEYSQILGKVIKVYGRYGCIDFDRRLVQMFQYYFLFRSLILLYTPFLFYKRLSVILRGRRFIVRCISS